MRLLEDGGGGTKRLSGVMSNKLLLQPPRGERERGEREREERRERKRERGRERRERRRERERKSLCSKEKAKEGSSFRNSSFLPLSFGRFSAILSPSIMGSRRRR